MSAKKVPHFLEMHGHKREDPYYWLRERENPDVINYLNEENELTEKGTAHIKGLIDEVFEEMKARLQPDENTAPYRMLSYYYYIRYEKGLEYPIHCRKKGSLEAEEEVVLDVNPLAEEHSYFHINRTMISYGENILAFAADTQGRRFYDIRFKNLDTGEMLPDVIENVTGGMTWANDNKTLFYARQHPDTLRSYQIYRHELGTDPGADVLVYEEADEAFITFVYKTKSRKYIVIGCSQTLSSEVRILNADDPTSEPILFQARERDHEYEIDHFKGEFYILSNLDGAKNFKMMKTDEDKLGKAHWREVIPHRDDVFLESFELFDEFTVLEERSQALMHLKIIPNDGSESHYLDFGESAYEAYTGVNFHADTTRLRYGYNSMTTPVSIYEYDMKTREKTLLKEEEVLGGFDKNNYHTERLHARAADGVEVPLSLVYRKDLKRPEGNPLLLYGYGSYGHSLDASFNSARLSLLDRGFVYCIAHVRGGQEMGRHWYDDGKLLNKKNTFTDFIAAGEHLIQQKYARADQLYAMGGSAGGLLMGAVMNMRPDLWAGLVAAVPFVDVVTTMLDDSIPLTTSEYDEWGNPNDEEYYHYILSYSPYDNIRACDYPPLLITTGLHDSQVQYWEPAKWVARLRELKTDDNPLFLKTDMEVGHSGATGRYKQLMDNAFHYGFLIDLAQQKK